MTLTDFRKLLDKAAQFVAADATVEIAVHPDNEKFVEEDIQVWVNKTSNRISVQAANYEQYMTPSWMRVTND